MEKNLLGKEPLFIVGIGQKQKGEGPFESHLFFLNQGVSPVRDISIVKRGEFYYLVNQMKVAAEIQEMPVNISVWWHIDSIGPYERRTKKTEGLETRRLPDKGTVVARLGLPIQEPIRFILWLEIRYLTEEGERKKDLLLCALEPDGVNLLPVLTSEDPYQVISKRVKELGG